VRVAPQFQLTEDEWQRKQAAWLLMVARDAAQTGDRDTAIRCLQRAARRHPRTVLDSRLVVLVVGLLLGRRGRMIMRASRHTRQTARLRRFSI